jgi:serine/threonine protein phosphatase PrpC
MQRPDFELASHSIPKPGKPRNGDHVLTHEVDQGIVVLVVADGVSSRPCDWLASETACRVATDAFAQASGTPVERIQTAIREANLRVSREMGPCQDMLAAFAIVAWEQGCDHAHFSGLGDTRIYHMLPNEIELLTQDDAITEMVRPDPKTSLPGAVPFQRRLISRAIGEPQDRPIEVGTVALPHGAGLALASDGLYPLGSFKSQLRRVYEAGNLQGALQAWLASSLLGNEDDATLAVLRRNDMAPENRAAYRRALDSGVDFRTQNLYAHLLLRELLDEMERSVAEMNGERIEQCVSYMETFSLRPSREVLIPLLDRLAANGVCERSLFDRVVQLVRLSFS